METGCINLISYKDNTRNYWFNLQLSKGKRKVKHPWNIAINAPGN